jgi:hypothetical protein
LQKLTAGKAVTQFLKKLPVIITKSARLNVINLGF